MILSIKNSGEGLYKLKFNGLLVPSVSTYDFSTLYTASSVSTYDFSTLYTTLLYNIQKKTC